MERRKFVLAAGGLLSGATLHATAIGATVLANTALVATAAKAPGIKAAGSATFSALLKQPFNVYASNRGASMQLIAVKTKHTDAAHDQFTLTFASATVLADGIYEVEHAQTGKQAMYLEASGKGAEGSYYRADFNLLA
ncbi:hypothetical protein HSX11_17095 [Oxalobacteraceae bacterium]|nr:hypothetical protein [Oxalobacteraceae bacterium]